MVARVGMPTIAKCTATVLAVGLLVGLWFASTGGNGTARTSSALDASLHDSSGSCAATVLDALRHVGKHVYYEGVASELTATARHFIVSSVPLRRAVERDDALATRKAAEAVLAGGHLTNLRVSRGAQVLADLGAPEALAPVHGTLIGARGAPIATYLTSVWTDSGFLAQITDITEGAVALRASGRSIAGSFALPPGELPDAGSITRNGIDYQYTSFPGEIYPSGGMRVYLLRGVASTARLCGTTSQDTVVNTISRVGALIYANELGPSALAQVHRVQQNPALLAAVARRDPAATRRAIAGLLNQHVVRLRVSAGGRLLADVGGPFVLAPKHATLQLGGQTIGSFVLSIQDDLGYRLLAQRLAGVDVVMRRGAKLVMSSLGPAPPPAPRSGSYRYRGRTYRVVTLHATAFPSGPLRITLLIPIPYL
jgi:hypothetical protein